MNVRVMIGVSAWVLTLFQTPARAQNSGQRTHSFETPIDLTARVGTSQEYPNTSQIVLDFREVKCIDRIELKLTASSGRPTSFVVGADAHADEFLIQDLLIATLTLPDGAQAYNYAFRVDRMLGQTTILVSGGGVRVLSARGIAVPDYYCPLMANHMAETWVKTAHRAYDAGVSQVFSIAFKMFLGDLKVASATLGTVSNGLPGLAAEKHRAPDTNPDVRKAAADLACLIHGDGEAVFAPVAPNLSVYQQVALPLFDLRDQIAQAYALDLERACPRRQ